MVRIFKVFAGAGNQTDSSLGPLFAPQASLIKPEESNTAVVFATTATPRGAV